MASCKPLHLFVDTQRKAREGFESSTLTILFLLLLFLSLLSFDNERRNFGDAVYLTFTAAWHYRCPFISESFFLPLLIYTLNPSFFFPFEPSSYLMLWLTARWLILSLSLSLSLSLCSFCHQSSYLFLIWIDLMPVLSCGVVLFLDPLSECKPKLFFFWCFTEVICRFRLFSLGLVLGLVWFGYAVLVALEVWTRGFLDPFASSRCWSFAEI